MKKYFFAIALALCHQANAQTISLTISDGSPNSPLNLSGTVECTQLGDPDSEIRTVLKGTLRVRNVSAKGIVAYVVELAVTTPLGTRRLLAFQNDCAFTEQVIVPNEMMDEIIDSDTISREPRSPSGEPPSAQATLVWAQYLDRSTYGSAQNAWQIIGARDFIWEKLNSLLRGFESGGPGAFERELMADISNPRAGPYIKRLRRIYEQDGIDRALASVRTAIQFATAHVYGK